MTIDESQNRYSEADSAFINVISKNSNNNLCDEIGLEEIEKIQNLRELVKNDLTVYYDTDFNLLRWIQGHRELPLNLIAKKLRAHLKMRKSNWDLDNLAKKPRKHTIHSHWMYGITGESQVLPNVIVNIEQCGATDYSGMLETFSHAEVLKARTQDLEDMLAEVMQQEQKTGKQASILYVMDMQGLKYDKRCFQLARGALRALTEFMAEHYVELIKYFVLVNVPSFIYAVWTISKPILPERTRQKVRILSSSNWRDEILSYASGKVLPESWEHGDSAEVKRFEARLKLPLPYPTENFFRNNCQNATDGAIIHKIAAGKSLILSKELFPGDILKWWILANSDFGFAVFRSKEKNINEENFDELDIAYPCFDWMPGPSEAPLTDRIVEVTSEAYYHIWISNRPAWWSTLTVQAKISVETTQPAA